MLSAAGVPDYARQSIPPVLVQAKVSAPRTEGRRTCMRRGMIIDEKRVLQEAGETKHLGISRRERHCGELRLERARIQ